MKCLIISCMLSPSIDTVHHYKDTLIKNRTESTDTLDSGKTDRDTPDSFDSYDGPGQ